MIKKELIKKGLLTSYVTGILDVDHGERYSAIMRYFIPEFISTLLLYSMLHILDAWWIAGLKDTSTYVALGISNNLLHFIVKIAEGLSIGTVILTGQYNGMRDYKEAGRSFVDAFWMTIIIGGLISSILYFGAYHIYALLDAPADVIVHGVPFLRLRAVAVFFSFCYFAFIGFMRGIKNTKTPMKIFAAGGAVFLLFDYLLIFGKCGFPRMGLQGSALAGVIQYVFMSSTVIFYLFYRRDSVIRMYSISLLDVLRKNSRMLSLLRLSWPVVIDKATLALSYIWLGKMIAPMGTYALAAFVVVKELERFAFLPALAFAQVITLLVSNDYGEQNWTGIKSNIKKVVFLSSCMVFGILLIFSVWPTYFIQFFDKKGDFTALASAIFPILSILVFFDLLQLILSGAMRGAANVKTVMMTRLIICSLYFAPVSYILASMNIQDTLLKFVLVYGSFYIGNALMSIVYINRFRSDDWKTHST